jgi:phosphatidylglycerol:prolipoprotein diacylglycerol transferase
MPPDESHSLLIHALFDVLAWASAALAGAWLMRGPRVRFPVEPERRWSYFAVLILGAALGAYAAGTLNLALSGMPGLARSIEGGLAGGIVAVETYKRLAGLAARTGARFALPLAVGIMVGRIGCFAAGLPDFTYGTPSALPWAYDFGDGVPRHPVQLYESLAMALFAAGYLLAVARGSGSILRNGFYWFVGFYGVQRFVWEFVKPYGALVGPFTLFHLLSAGLALYAAAMLASAAPETVLERARGDALPS